METELDERRNVLYVIVAEFDIDKGSVIRQQYPEACGISEGVLADLMLPAGAHLRDTDTTVFLLREEELVDEDAKCSSVENFDEVPAVVLKLDRIMQQVLAFSARAACYKFNEDAADWVPLHQENVKIMFSVDTANVAKHRSRKFLLNIASDDRETVMAIPICIEIEFTVLQERFCSMYPSIESDDAVGILFDKASDLTDLQKLISEVIEVNDEIGMESQSTIENSTSEKRIKWPQKRLICLNQVRTELDESVKRGAVCKAMGICTPYRWFMKFKPLVAKALEEYFRSPTKELIVEFFDVINSLDVSPLRELPWSVREVRRAARKIEYAESYGADQRYYFSTSAEWRGETYRISVPLVEPPGVISDSSVITLVQTYGEALMIVYNAILTEKRILFLAHNQPTEQLCRSVFSCCSLVCPPFPNLMDRIYPYCSLTALEFLEKPGFIAGVSNPIFEGREEWWDVLVNVATGEVRLSSSYEREIVEGRKEDKEGSLMSIDSEFFEELQRGVVLNYSEDWFRAQFEHYTEKILLMFESKRVGLPNSSDWRFFVDANKKRVKQIAETKLYARYEKTRAYRRTRNPFTPKESCGLAQLLQRFDYNPNPMPSSRLRKDFAMLLKVLNSDEKVTEFLSYMRPARGGLTPMASCLFDPDLEIQRGAFELLKRIDSLQEGSGFIAGLNYFLIFQYNRMKTEDEGHPVDNIM
eukprot:435524_1